MCDILIYFQFSQINAEGSLCSKQQKSTDHHIMFKINFPETNNLCSNLIQFFALPCFAGSVQKTFYKSHCSYLLSIIQIISKLWVIVALIKQVGQEIENTMYE